MNRRELLRSSGLSLATTLAGGAAASLGAGNAAAMEAKEAPDRELPRVRVSPDRVIRNVVCHRPYRASGFVVRSEKLGGKTVVHNYGHGGAGVTLSWGTAHLAVEEGLKTGEKRAAVLGCGAVGLATARLLQQRGLRVTIYAKSLPPETTSNNAGALWYPISAYDPKAVSPEFEAQFLRACRISHRWFQEMVGEQYGVRWIRHFFLHSQRPARLDLIGGDLYPENRLHPAPKRFFGFPYAQQCHMLMIDPATYLSAVLRDFLLAGGELVVREFADGQEIASLPATLVLNCTGLGAKTLFGDAELTPVKGQLSLLLPQPEVDYGMIVSGEAFLYMFPRKSAIVLGGTHQHGDSSPDPDPRETERILREHARIFR